MRIVIASVGQAKGDFGPIEDDYVAMATKLGRTVGLKGIDRLDLPQSKAQRPADRMAEEAERIAAALKGAPFFALDPGGKATSTEEFAGLIRQRLETGVPTVGFVIGGPDGMAPSVKTSSAGLISYGRATFPHRLVRVMLTEQIYRVVTILANHPYHRAG